MRRVIVSSLFVIALWCTAPAAAAPIPVTGTLDLSTAFDARYVGEGGLAGRAVAAGDFNGDAVPDLAVGAPGTDDGRGAVFVVFGDRGLAAGASAALPQAPGFTIRGAASGDAAGLALASAGDVNGDGADDLLVGAPGADPAGRMEAGAAALVLGRAGTAPVDLGTAAVTVIGAAAGDALGSSVAALPDADGDGRPELVAGSPGADRDLGADDAYVPEDRRQDAGAVTVVFTPAPGAAIVDAGALADAGYRIRGAGGGAGASVAGLPDWNGDGRAEVAVGAPRFRHPRRTGGQASVVFGGPAGADVDLAGPAGRALVLDGAANQRLGHTVASVGDVDGDGIGDLAVSAPYAGREIRYRAGRVTIVYARWEGGAMELRDLGAGATRLEGEKPFDYVGSAIGAAGDMNGDGRADLVVGAARADALNRRDAGAAYAIFGGARRERLDLALLGDSGYRIAGAARGDLLGRGLAGMGDLNGDNRADLALGHPGGNGGATIVLGPPPPVADPIEQRPPDPGAEEEVEEDGCHAATDLQVIVDDSGSMADTDPTDLRAKALRLLLVKQRNVGERLGAVEFGSLAERLFAPVLLGGQDFADAQKELDKLIRERIKSDAGGTDYNAAFEGARLVDPDADAIVFLTDGGHNEGRFAARHRGGPLVYVIGLGIGEEGVDGRRLQRIADETDGRYYPSVDDEHLQSVLNQIDSRLNCDTDFGTSADTIADGEAPDPAENTIERGTHSSDVIVTWDDPRDEIELASIRLLDRKGERIAGFSRRKVARALRSDDPIGSGRLRLAGDRGRTYLALRVNGLRRGVLKVRFARADLKGGAEERIVTQITESRRRR
jgi:hypothetical protein